MNIFQTTRTVGDVLADHAAAAIREKADAERAAKCDPAEAKRQTRHQMRTALRVMAGAVKTTFPNDTCGYVFKAKAEKAIKTLTPAERFARLKAAYLAGPMPRGTHFRKPTRGRSKRRRIIGVKWWPRAYSFDPLFRLAYNEKHGIAAA